MAMAPSSDSEPCVAQRPPVPELQPARNTGAEGRAPEAAGTSQSSGGDKTATAAEARPDEPAAEAERKKDNRAAEDHAATGTGGLFRAADPARRPPAAAGEESARERLKRHRTEMAGRVRIPDMWGQERLLKDWVDCAVFDRPLAATAGLLNARDALVAECVAARRTTGRPLRVQNGCS